MEYVPTATRRCICAKRGTSSLLVTVNLACLSPGLSAMDRATHEISILQVFLLFPNGLMRKVHDSTLLNWFDPHTTLLCLTRPSPCRHQLVPPTGAHLPRRSLRFLTMSILSTLPRLYISQTYHDDPIEHALFSCNWSADWCCTWSSDRRQ